MIREAYIDKVWYKEIYTTGGYSSSKSVVDFSDHTNISIIEDNTFSRRTNQHHA